MDETHFFWSFFDLQGLFVSHPGRILLSSFSSSICEQSQILKQEGLIFFSWSEFSKFINKWTHFWNHLSDRIVSWIIHRTENWKKHEKMVYSYIFSKTNHFSFLLLNWNAFLFKQLHFSLYLFAARVFWASLIVSALLKNLWYDWGSYLLIHHDILFTSCLIIKIFHSKRGYRSSLDPRSWRLAYANDASKCYQNSNPFEIRLFEQLQT